MIDSKAFRYLLIDEMSTSPPNYDFEGDPLLEAYMNAKFSEEISEKMKVPKRSKLHINQTE